MPYFHAGIIISELLSAPSPVALGIVSLTSVLLAIIRSDTPVTRALAKLLRRRLSR